mgnify:CR=1 FL=1
MKDPGSAITHLIAMVAAAIASVPLLIKAAKTPGYLHLAALAVFILSMICLYGASTLYHTLNISPVINKRLRKLDHMMIFVLIAGTYTPICITALRGGLGWTLLVVIWTAGILGMILKGVWMNAPRWLSTLIYAVMGWMIILAIYPLAKAIPAQGTVFLVMGGLFYTIGAVIYGLKWPKINFKYFGFHEIFHIFILLGSLAHFFAVFKYVI